MILLVFGDIFGRVGRQAIAATIGDLRSRYDPDFIFGNAENMAGGRGVNLASLSDMFALGFDGLTSGNHIWDNKEVFEAFQKEPRLLRPFNYPDPPDNPCPGKGYRLFHSQTGKKLFVVNVMGRVFMDSIDCPFQAIDRALEKNTEKAPVLVDMHADATSEKAAMGWYLAGKVAAVLGSHSHVQTADERVLPGGTAFITDVGLSGSFDSCIGMRKEEIIERFRTKRKVPFALATENPGVSAVVIFLDPHGKATKIERIRETVRVDGMHLEER